MSQPPYTYAEAKQICEEFQHITGSPYSKHSSSIIDVVIISPYDAVSKSRFIMLYLMLNDARTALVKDYVGAQYDVIVVSGSISNNGMQHQSLCEWIGNNTENRGMVTKMPETGGYSISGSN